MFNYELLCQSLPQLLKGMLATIGLSIACIALSLIIGTLLGVVRHDRGKIGLLSKLIDFYISYVRGVPYFIQLLLAYFVFPEILGIEISALTAGIVSLGICSAGHTAEIVRGGMNSIPEGQWEAATALGYSRFARLRQIIMPQMFYFALPALFNECIGVVKSTSMLSAIGILEVTKVGQNIIAREMDPVTIYLAIAAMYYCFIMLIAYCGKRLEKTFAYVK